MIAATTPVFLPAVLTTKEFAYLVRLHPETVRAKIRTREIAARGRPARIASRELLKFGISMAEAARAISFLKQPPEAA